MGIIAEAHRQRTRAAELASEVVPDLKMYGLDPKALEPIRQCAYRPLHKGLTKDRAIELLAELGFLGVVDLVAFLAATMDGSLECVAPRFIVKIKQKPRVRKPKPAKKAASRGSRAT